MDKAVELLDPAARRAPTAPHGVGSAYEAPASRQPVDPQPGDLPLFERVADRLEWRIRCHDALDRERCLTVVVQDGQVLVVGPPGETAVLSPGQLGQFRTALLEAAKQAEG